MDAREERVAMIARAEEAKDVPAWLLAQRRHLFLDYDRAEIVVPERIQVNAEFFKVLEQYLTTRPAWYRPFGDDELGRVNPGPTIRGIPIVGV